jgi:RNA polymerase sigma-70 factor (ECF subfamily)
VADSVASFATTAGVDLTAEEGAQLRAALAAAHAAGAVAWPALPLPAEALARHLARLHPQAAQAPDALSRLALADLYLVAAVLDGVAGANLALEQHLAAGVERQLGGMRLDADARDEVRQRLRVKLLIGGAQGPALLAFDGRAALRTWVHVIAARLVFDVRERARPEAETLEGEQDALERAAPLLPSIEHKLVARERRRLVLTALGEAMASLPDRDRALLRLHFVEGAAIDTIAPMYQVHRATVARWLGSARDRLHEALGQALARHGIDELERADVLGATMSQLDLGLSAIFRR